MAPQVQYTSCKDNSPESWFVLNYISHSFVKDAASKDIEKFNFANARNLQLFAPTYVVQEQKDGKTRLKSAKLAFHYVFVRGTEADIKTLASQTNGFSLVIDRSSNENKYAVVSDCEMHQFMTIARAYGNRLPYYSLEDIDLEDGDLVEIVNGDFPGLVGTYMPRAKSKSGNIVLMVYNNVGTIVYNIKASDVRVLEFSKNSTRANDQIDAFIPVLLKALRHYHAGEPLPTPLTAKLTIFCRRMDSVRLPNKKLDAKLQALLFAANHLLSNPTLADLHYKDYLRLMSHITNSWTQSLVDIILYSINKNTTLRLKEKKISTSSKYSIYQSLISQEFDYYLNASGISPKSTNS